MGLNALQDKIKQLSAFNINEALLEIFTANTEVMADLQRNQMETGLDKNNNPVMAVYGSFYQPSTIKNKKYKKGISAITDRVTNYMSGEFYTSIKKEVQLIGNGIIETNSDVSYFEYIHDRSGEVALDLNQENKAEFTNKIILPQLSVTLNKIL